MAESLNNASENKIGTDFWGTGRRKNAIARVRVRPGQGKIVINNRAAENYFVRQVDLRFIRQPLELTSTLAKVDVFVSLQGGGSTGQSGAVQHGLARALAKMDPEMQPTLAKAGYMTRDARMVERKKYGQAGARRRFQFSKR
jgi:small subunit ribosomal protein S9